MCSPLCTQCHGEARVSSCDGLKIGAVGPATQSLPDGTMLASCGPARSACGRVVPPVVPGALAGLTANTNPTAPITVNTGTYAALDFNGGYGSFGTSIRRVTASSYLLADPGTYLVSFTVPVDQGDSTGTTYASLFNGLTFQSAVTLNGGLGTLSGSALISSDGTNAVSVYLKTTGAGGNAAVIPVSGQAIVTIVQLSRSLL